MTSKMTGFVLSQYAATQWWRSNLDATGAEAPVAHAVEFSKTVAARLAGSPPAPTKFPSGMKKASLERPTMLGGGLATAA